MGPSRSTEGMKSNKGQTTFRRTLDRMHESQRHRIFTIGHGVRPIEDVIRDLTKAGVRRLVDVRTSPGSRRNPQFGREVLAEALGGADIAYEWRRELGGFRKPRPDSRNRAIRNDSFRGYADHMDKPEFRTALDELEETSLRTTTAIMCSESVWWRCHRRMIADALLVDGWEVVHLMPGGRSQAHKLHPDARVEDHRLVYDAGQPALDVDAR
jgi:uncharacterized protein (DUF488 family)